MPGQITPVVMPKFGLAMTEGKIASWSVDEGASVSVGDDLADIETSKITNAYESPAAGILRRQVAPAGEMYSVGALIGVIAEASVTDGEIDDFISSFEAPNEGSSRDEDAAPAAQPKVIDVGGQGIRVLDMDAHGGVPVILIHGFGGDLNNWLFTQEPLAAHQRVISFDLPGHGGSDKHVTAPSKAGLAATALALLDALAIEKAHFIGHSLGGGVALAAALAAPSRVASLSLIAPAGIGEEINTAYTDGFIEASRARDLEAVLKLLFADKSLVSRDMVQDVIKFKRLDGAVDGLRTVGVANFANGKQIEIVRDQIGTISVPIQIIWGEADEIIPSTQAQGLPGSVKVSIMAQAGHMPQMEKSGAVNALLADFLKD